MLETIWFALWGVLWTVYFMADGYDLGLGLLMPFLARNDRERRVIFNAQGPFWDGNEVWLITAGGATFAAFPKTYAVMFSLAVHAAAAPAVRADLPRDLLRDAVQGAVRPVAQHVGRRHDRRSFLAALLLGVAFANIFRGLPLDSEGILHGNLLTLLNPYGLLGGVLFVLIFGVHGSLWLTIKAGGEIKERGARMAARLWPFLLVVAVTSSG